MFPYAILFSLFYLKYIYKPILAIFFYISFIQILSFLINTNIPIDFFRSYLAYLNPLFAVLLVYSNFKLRRIFVKYIKIYFYFLVFLGTCQYFNLIPFLEVFLKFIVPRSSAFALEESGRGVTLLSTEPSRAGVELLFMYAFLRCIQPVKSNKVISDFLFLFYILVFIKSFTVFSLTLFYLMIIYFDFRKIIFYLFIVFILGYYLIQSDDTSRTVLLLKDLSSRSFEEQYFLLINTSGNRLISILTFYPYSFHYTLGGGIGNWINSSQIALKYANINPSDLNFFKYDYNIGMRGSGYFTNLALDLGIVGFAPVAIYIVYILRQLLFINKRYLSIYILFIFSLFFIGSVGTTTTWVLCFSLLFNYKIDLLDGK